MPASHALPLRARVEGALARLVLGLPHPLVRLLAGRPISLDGNTLDPQVQLTLALERLVDPVPMAQVTLEHARSQVEKNAGALAPRTASEVRTEELTVAGAAGTLAARLYRPEGVVAPAPALVFFHGGGFVVGSLDSHDALCRVLAERARCVVIAVDYRLAPEHPFPAGVDDALAAFRDLAARASSLGLDPARLAIGGDSAGGNLATVVALDTRRDAVRPAVQLLLYPVVDATSSYPSVETFREGFFLDRETIDWYVVRYLPAGIDRRAPRASPLFEPDLSGSPATILITAGFDPLRDEGHAYVERLRKAGVPVEERLYGSMFHGFLNTAGAIDEARRALDEIGELLGTALRRGESVAPSRRRAVD